MSTLRNYDYDEAVMAIEETAAERLAKQNRLRTAKIKCELKVIDNARIRPMAAILAGVGTDDDSARLAELEIKAKILREELAGLEV